MKTNTRIDNLVPWSGGFDWVHPLFEPLRPWLERFQDYSDWPGLDAYQRIFYERADPVRTLGGAALKIVPQDGKPTHFEQHYAPRIHRCGEIQTRSRNWHDFFQMLTWLAFPKTKAVINALHIPTARQRLAEDSDPGRRSPLENMLSLFDEGGAVLVSADARLLRLAQDFRWKELFWQHRQDLEQNFTCIVFGHALYEKGLTPYLGMTANAILIEVETSWFLQSSVQRMEWIDQYLANSLERKDRYLTPRDLSPFPLLGMPGWDDCNSSESYYDNTDYFRPGRRRG